MKKVDITIASELETALDLVEGIRMITNGLTDENVTVQVGLSSVTLPKDLLYRLVDSIYIDFEMNEEVLELAAELENKSDEEFDKEMKEAQLLLDDIDETESKLNEIIDDTYEIDGSDEER